MPYKDEEKRKETNRKAVKNYYRKNKEKRKKYIKKWLADNYEEQLIKRREYQRAYYHKIPREIRRTREQSRRLFKKGLIEKTNCEICGNEKIEIHHKSYKDPMVFHQLCKLCHAKVHSGEIIL